MSEQPIDPKKLQWKCRRGMLELDLMLEGFCYNYLAKMSQEERHLFNEVLDQPDPVLYDWLLGHDKPENPQYQAMIDLISRNKN